MTNATTDRARAIQEIEQLFSPDAEGDTGAAGMEIMLRAIARHWRLLLGEVLGAMLNMMMPKEREV